MLASKDFRKEVRGVREVTPVGESKILSNPVKVIYSLNDSSAAYDRNIVCYMVGDNKMINISGCIVAKQDVSQYASIIYQGIPSGYRPSDNSRINGHQAETSTSYPFQVLPTGTLQTLSAISSGTTVVFNDTWRIA